MTKERENESWKLLKEQEAACSKDIRALTEEKEECFEKIKQVNLQVRLYNKFNVN